MTWESFLNLVKLFGFPAAFAFVVIFALRKGWLVWDKDVQDKLSGCQLLIEEKKLLITEKNKQIADKDVEITRIRAEYEQRLDTLREEKNYWRDMAMATQNELERSAKITETAVGIIHRQKPPDGD